ncbi:carboxymuconolactone decarboxylase family protein [Streptomyces sp. NPDC093707]|uniref:carboxymuconolactone decarboxylase family protein n=1 Tax=Streptomyces sp. NPDC093707 TaxID=3154984 RepID=UPI00344CC4F5
MSRIPLTPVESVSPAARDFMRRHGELNVFRLLAGAPKVFDGWSAMVDTQLGSRTFGPRLRELVVLRTAHLQRCAYQIAQHTSVGRRAGISPAEISALSTEGPVSGFTEPESTVLAFVSELCTTGTVTQETFAAARTVLDEPELSELLLLVSLYYGLAIVLNAVDPDIDHDARLETSS